jgi:hypothetical protein
MRYVQICTSGSYYLPGMDGAAPRSAVLGPHCPVPINMFHSGGSSLLGSTCSEPQACAKRVRHGKGPGRRAIRKNSVTVHLLHQKRRRNWAHWVVRRFFFGLQASAEYARQASPAFHAVVRTCIIIVELVPTQPNFAPLNNHLPSPLPQTLVSPDFAFLPCLQSHLHLTQPTKSWLPSRQAAWGVRHQYQPTRQCGIASQHGSPSTRPLSIPLPVSPL